MNEEITMTSEELENLKEVYGEDDPDLCEAFALKGEEESFEVGPNLTVPPTETGEEAAASAVEDVESRQEGQVPPNGRVPLAALHEERRKRQEATQRAQKLEEELSYWKRKKEEETPEKGQTGAVEKFLHTPPGKLAKRLFSQEQGMEYDPYNPEHQERLQELTSLVTVRQLQTGEMYRQVQVEREKFATEVLQWRDEILSKPEVEYRAMERFSQLPDSAQKRILAAAWERLVSGQASRDEFDLIREFSAETEREMNGTKGSGASLQAAMGLPRTANVSGGAGMKVDRALDLIEQKLDRGERLTPEEESLIKSLV